MCNPRRSTLFCIEKVLHEFINTELCVKKSKAAGAQTDLTNTPFCTLCMPSWEPANWRCRSSTVSSPTCSWTSLTRGPQRPGAGMQAIASSPLRGHWRIRRHWLAAKIDVLSALRTLTSVRTSPSSSARRLCTSITCQRHALWTTRPTGRRGARWGRSRPSSWSTAPLTDMTHTPSWVAFGELPTSCYSLCTSIARVAAARLLSFREMSPEQALAFSKQQTIRF